MRLQVVRVPGFLPRLSTGIAERITLAGRVSASLSLSLLLRCASSLRESLGGAPDMRVRVYPSSAVLARSPEGTPYGGESLRLPVV